MSSLKAVVASAGVALKRGNPAFGLCPFHKEHTGSFAVYDDHAHCFGCGWHGDAITWFMEHDGLSFRDAAKRAIAAGLSSSSKLRDRQRVSEAPRPSEPPAEQPAPHPPGTAESLYDDSDRIAVRTAARRNLVEERGLWPADVNIPPWCRRLSCADAMKHGVTPPADTAGLLMYCFTTGVKTLHGVALEAISKQGDVIPWSNGDLLLKVPSSTGDVNDAAFTVKGVGKARTVVFCDTPETALASHWLHHRARAFVTFAESGEPEGAGEGVSMVAEGHPKWAAAINSEWTWMERAEHAGMPADDLRYIGDGDAGHARRLIQAVSDYRVLTAAGWIGRDDWC